MAFFSTRGGEPVTASQAILRGLAPNGGLYVPENFPAVTLDFVAGLGKLPYPERAAKILQMYLDDYSSEQLQAATQAAYGDKFDCAEVAPVKKIAQATYVLELFHGPTLAFKDMALQLLPHLVSQAAQRNGEQREISILVATSGDTGKAALEGFKDVPGTSCTVFYPRDGVSDVQKLQMVTTGGSNTCVISVNGNFDDAQTGVKQLFGSEAFHQQMDAQGRVLSSANSINFGRLVPQIVYYFSAYADLVNQGEIRLGDAIDFVVPTGNFGNILAGYYACRMGLPIRKLWCASNRNQVLTDFFATGEYTAQRPFHKTISPSMDILISSNLERLLYEAAGRKDESVQEWMKGLKADGSYQVTEEQLAWMKDCFGAGCANDEETQQEIARVYAQCRYLMDPHTAVASRVIHDQRQGDGTPVVIVSTASPYKFCQDVLAALEKDVNPDAFACAQRLEALTGMPVPPQVKALRELPIRHTLTCEKQHMGETVRAALANHQSK